MATSGYGKKSTASMVVRENNLNRLEKHMLRGISNQHELAASFGVTQQTISNWMGEIYSRWRDRSPQTIEDCRVRRVQQMDYLGSLAVLEFERSKKATEDFTIEVRACPDCDGRKTVEKPADNDRESKNVACDRCNGKGTISVERVIVKEQNGNPAYLATAKSCFIEAAKLEGLQPSSTTVKKTIFEEIKGADGEIRRSVEELYYDVPTDVIIRARATLDDLKRTIKNQKGITVESEVVKSETVVQKEQELPLPENEESTEE